MLFCKSSLLFFYKNSFFLAENLWFLFCCHYHSHYLIFLNTQVATNVQIKQQLPLKLATKLGGGSGGSQNSGGGLGGGIGSGPQQMLPLKLSSAPGSEKKSGGYQRLGSPPDPPLPLPPPSHSRTGSSPAMMQNIQVHIIFCIRYLISLSLLQGDVLSIFEIHFKNISC